MTKIVQIGCGHWGKNLTRNFAEIGALAGVIDGNPDTASRMAKAYDVPVFTLDAALADPAVLGISLATPALTHAALAKQALYAGKHVYVEKPLALNADDAEALVRLADEHSLTLMVGHLLQYHPVFREMQRQVEAGLIGDVQYVYSNRMSLGKFRTEENVLWSFAPHDFSMLLSLVGQEPNRVTAQGASFVTPGIADWCTVQFAFENGVRGHIQTSWLNPFKEQRLVVIGSAGMLVFEDSAAEWDKKLVHYAHRIVPTGAGPEPQKADAVFLPVDKGEPLKDECRHFVECIQTGATPRTDGREGLAVLRALNMAEEALRASLKGNTA